MTDSRPPLHSQVKRRAIDAAKRKEGILAITEKYLGGWPTEVMHAKLIAALEWYVENGNPLPPGFKGAKFGSAIELKDYDPRDFRKKLQAKQRMTGKQRYGGKR